MINPTRVIDVYIKIDQLIESSEKFNGATNYEELMPIYKFNT